MGAKIWVGLLLAWSLLAQHAQAQTAFGGLLGYSQGTLDRSDTETMSGFSVQGHVGYDYKQYNVYGFFQNTDVAYVHNDESYTGTYTLYGLGAKYSFFPNNKSRISVALQLPASAALTTLAESEGLVNGKTYIYSSLTSLSGVNAVQALMGYEYLRQGRGGNRRGESLYLGLYFSYMQQQFSKQVTRIKTNNSVLAPISPGAEKVSYSFALMSLFFSLNYDL